MSLSAEDEFTGDSCDRRIDRGRRSGEDRRIAGACSETIRIGIRPGRKRQCRSAKQWDANFFHARSRSLKILIQRYYPPPKRPINTSIDASNGQK